MCFVGNGRDRELRNPLLGGRPLFSPDGNSGQRDARPHAPPAHDLGSHRDPGFIRAHLDKLAFVFDHYHHASVEGLEHIPAGRALVVGNHSGGAMSPDMFALMLA